MSGTNQHSLQPQQLLMPQAYLTNFHNRIRTEDVPMFVSAPPARGHKRAKVVNYAEFDNDIFNDFSAVKNNERSLNGNDWDTLDNNSADTNNLFNDLKSLQSYEGLSAKKDGIQFGRENNDESSNSQNHLEDEQKKDALPDIKDQEDMLSLIRYPKIRATFFQSKIATPYRLDIPPDLSTNQQEPIIIPININIEHGDHTITDFFTWNINDHSITPEEFATIYCRDLSFTNSTSLHSQIVSSINDQIQEYETVASVMVPDLHVIVNLSCSLENKLYEDNFQWNLTDKSLSPEIFAELVASDLGLTREFIPLIANALHEYVLKVKKQWLDGNLNQDHVPNGAAFGYLSGIRLDIDELGASWCPRVEVLTPEEIQKREIEKERNLRRLKRDADRMGMGRRTKRRLDNLESSLRI